MDDTNNLPNSNSTDLNMKSGEIKADAKISSEIPFPIPKTDFEKETVTTESQPNPTSTVAQPVFDNKPKKSEEIINKPQNQSETAIPSAPARKRIPKILIVIAVALVFVVMAFFAYKLIADKKQKNVGEITWWGLWEDDRIVKPLIDEFQTANPGVTVKYVKQSPQDYRERLVNAIVKGEAPDVFRFHNSWVPMLAKDLDNVPSSVMGAADFAQNYYPVITENASWGSGLVGIPLGYDALTLFINEDIFSQAGIDPPTTWVELRERALQLTQVENEVITQAGVALGRTENVDHWPEIVGLMFLQNGVNMNNPKGKLAEDALVYYTLFSKTDHVWDETMPPSTIAFASGKLAMYFGPSWRYFNIKEANPDLNFRTVPLPQLPKESPEEPNVSYATYWLEGVWAKSKNKDIAWNFLKFISSKESLQKLYTNQSQLRDFGEPYPRVDMGNLLLEHPIVGSIIKLAPEAQSWYLVDRTYDGATGINSQINKYFADAINSLYGNDQVGDVVETLNQGVVQVLTQYGLIKN